MRRMRSGLLFAAAVTLIGLAASPLAGQVAPTLTGDTGLFELRNADMIPAGHFSFGLFYSQWDRSAAPTLSYPPGADDPMRYGVGKLGLTAAWAATNTFQLDVAFGQRYFSADERDWSGTIGGHERYGHVRHSETDKIRIGAKLLLNPKVDPVKVVLFGGWAIPMQTKSDPDALSTYRADYDFGFSLNYGVTTFETSYLIAGDQGEAWDVPNELKFGLGLGFPIIKDRLKLIGEVNRLHYDGGTTKPIDFSEALAGVRFAIGDLVVGGAVRVNIDNWVKYGWSPNPVAGLVQLSYSPQPAAAVAATAPAAAAPEEPAPAPAPGAEPAPAAPAATPAPSPTPTAVEPPPAPRAETSTTDEVLYDAGKSRLTNIAKAILDGVALRLKNNLAATCTITGFADKGEKGDHMALAKARAEAAKDYLVKRHGIDAGRIAVETKGDAEAGADATRNRRAVVSVTFP